METMPHLKRALTEWISWPTKFVSLFEPSVALKLQFDLTASERKNVPSMCEFDCAPGVLKIGGNFFVQVKKIKVTSHSKYAFSIFQVQVVTFSRHSWKGVMFSWRINLFSDKININKVPVPFTSQRYKRNVGERTQLFHKPSSHIAYLFKQSTEYISKRASQLAVETCFLNSEMPKKFHPCPRINKSTEQHPRVTYYSPIFFPTTANHCSLQYYWSQQVGPREMRRKLYI